MKKTLTELSMEKGGGPSEDLRQGSYERAESRLVGKSAGSLCPLAQHLQSPKPMASVSTYGV